MKDLPVSARSAMQEQNDDDIPESVRIRSLREYERITGRRIRRKLFADDEQPGDRENAMNLITDDNKRQQEEDKKRWNFDFVEGKPLPGNWEYTKLDKDENGVDESWNKKKEETEVGN